MNFYPVSIGKVLSDLQHCETIAGADAQGTASDFTCGGYVLFLVKIDPATRFISRLTFRSNLCGYGIAAADILSRELVGKHLGELGGMENTRLSDVIRDYVPEFDVDRKHCEDTVIEGLQSVFASYRKSRLSSFNGDDPVVCTCFGVSEETIEKALEVHKLKSVEAVSEVCRAGLGCGSCRMLIQGMIDDSR